MSKIYVITSGRYSDYRIERVTTNKSIADAYVMIHTDSRIEEFEELTDTSLIKVAKEYKKYYLVNIDANGKCSVSDETHFYPLQKEPKPLLHEGCELKMYVLCDDKTKEQAKKIARDTRAQMIAERFGL